MNVQEAKPRQYLEVRPTRRTMSDGLATDLARHLHTRQHLGSAVIVTGEPLKLLAVVRKQWFKLARHLQRERASTVNAQKILHLTYAVTRMHNLAFVAKTPEQRPDASVFFVPSEELHTNPPPQCYSLYLTEDINAKLLHKYIRELPSGSLVVDYANATASFANMFRAKESLNEQVRSHWRQVLDFLQELHIDISALARQSGPRPNPLDDAIDILLDYSDDFLRIAGIFQHTYQLAQPLEPLHETQREYNTLTLLAHRVQTLQTGKLSDYLDSIVADNSFFLRDGSTERNIHWELVAVLAYHKHAGHLRIYRKLTEISGYAFNFSGAIPLT
jgi:hypothetical protein